MCYLNWWSINSFILLGPGYWSVIMHETGHCYGCEGDTWMEHLDVMDYYWGNIYPHSSPFDNHHQEIIGPNRGLHSD